jgi:hypothetical protein
LARFYTILIAVSRAANRGSRSLRHVSGNNMFYAGFTLMFLGDPAAMGFFLILSAIVLFLPSSSDPMTAVPRERLDLWPLTVRERYALRLVSPLLNPLAWVMLAGMIWKRVTWGLWAFVASFFLAGFIGSSFRMPGVWVRRIPMGILTQMVRKDLRQFLTALDLYCALLIALPALYFRLTGKLPVDARVPLTGLIIVIMSTMALTLFGLDGESGFARYSLWPLSGWRVLAAKGIAYLLLLILVTLPLSPGGGLAGGFISLAVGQWVSINQWIPQSRWRFRASRRFAYSLAQMILALCGFAAVTQLGILWLGLCLAVYALSLWICGRHLKAKMLGMHRQGDAS